MVLLRSMQIVHDALLWVPRLMNKQSDDDGNNNDNNNRRVDNNQGFRLAAKNAQQPNSTGHVDVENSHSKSNFAEGRHERWLRRADQQKLKAKSTGRSSSHVNGETKGASAAVDPSAQRNSNKNCSSSIVRSENKYRNRATSTSSTTTTTSLTLSEASNTSSMKKNGCAERTRKRPRNESCAAGGAERKRKARDSHSSVASHIMRERVAQRTSKRLRANGSFGCLGPATEDLDPCGAYLQAKDASDDDGRSLNPCHHQCRLRRRHCRHDDCGDRYDCGDRVGEIRQVDATSCNDPPAWTLCVNVPTYRSHKKVASVMSYHGPSKSSLPSGRRGSPCGPKSRSRARSGQTKSSVAAKASNSLEAAPICCTSKSNLPYCHQVDPGWFNAQYCEYDATAEDVAFTDQFVMKMVRNGRVQTKALARVRHHSPRGSSCGADNPNSLTTSLSNSAPATAETMDWAGREHELVVKALEDAFTTLEHALHDAVAAVIKKSAEHATRSTTSTIAITSKSTTKMAVGAAAQSRDKARRRAPGRPPKANGRRKGEDDAVVGTTPLSALTCAITPSSTLTESMIRELVPYLSVCKSLVMRRCRGFGSAVYTRWVIKRAKEGAPLVQCCQLASSLRDRGWTRECVRSQSASHQH